MVRPLSRITTMGGAHRSGRVTELRLECGDSIRVDAVYDQNGRGLKRPQTNKARQNGRMNRSFHLAVVVHLYTYMCYCCVLYTGL